MADLEDQFFKINIPGRYSAWEDDGGDDDDREGLANDAAPAVSSASSPPNPTAALNRIEATTSRNTGAKGVLADHRAAKEEEAYQREMERRERDAILDRAVRGTRLQPGQVSISTAAIEERNRADRIRTRDAECDDSDDDDDSELDDEDDDDFFRSYRQKRLLELQSEATNRGIHNHHQSSSSQYGEIEDMTPIQYAQAVDDTDPNTTLVVHLYESYIAACNDVNNHLEVLSRAMPTVRFARLAASEARPGFDPVGLPSLLVYRGGSLVHNLTPVTEHLPKRFTAEDVRTLLESCDATSSGKGESGSHAAGHISNANGARCVNDYDSSDAEFDESCADFAG